MLQGTDLSAPFARDLYYVLKQIDPAFEFRLGTRLSSANTATKTRLWNDRGRMTAGCWYSASRE